MAGEFWLIEEQFERLTSLLLPDTPGVARVDDRLVISDIVHVLVSGGHWVEAQACYGPRQTLYAAECGRQRRACGSRPSRDWPLRLVREPS